MNGLSCCYWSGFLVPVMVYELKSHTELNEKEKTSWALFAMVSFGFGEVIGGHLTGMVIDKYGSKIGSIKNVILAILVTSVTIISINMGSYNYMTFIMAFFWGYEDAANNIHSF